MLMPALASVQATIDTQLAALRTGTLSPQQSAYRAGRLKFFQGIVTTDLSALPNNTDVSLLQTTVPNLARRPTDQAEDWGAFGVAVASLAFAVEIHNYGGPLGEGWVIIVYFKHNDRIFSRAVNIGPETHRDSPWTQVLQT